MNNYFRNILNEMTRFANENVLVMDTLRSIGRVRDRIRIVRIWYEKRASFDVFFVRWQIVGELVDVIYSLAIFNAAAISIHISIRGARYAILSTINTTRRRFHGEPFMQYN